jgi:hypothetical protein
VLEAFHDPSKTVFKILSERQSILFIMKCSPDTDSRPRIEAKLAADPIGCLRPSPGPGNRRPRCPSKVLPICNLKISELSIISVNMEKWIFQVLSLISLKNNRTKT